MKNKFLFLLLASSVLALGSLSAQTNDAPPPDSPMVQSNEKATEKLFHHAERRESMPFQIQLVGSFGPATPNSFAPGGGLHLGYQFSKALYVGLTSSAFSGGANAWDDCHKYSYDDDDERGYNDGEIYGQDGSRITESELDPMHLLEVRVTPWDFGLYFSFGAMYRGKQTSTTDFKTETRIIGENIYTTGLTAVVEYKEWYGAAAGIGFAYIFQSGATLGGAMNLGLNSQTPDVAVSSDASVKAEDLEYWKKQIQSNERQLPYLVSLSVGYAF